jgi:hypothetical protein
MGYDINAILTSASTIEASGQDGVGIISLPQGMSLVPLTERHFGGGQSDILPDEEATVSNARMLSQSVSALASEISKSGIVAYIEAKFWAGVGTQAAVVWKDGSVTFGPVIGGDAINQALRLLGVDRGDARDEFDALGLGKYRHTAEWISKGDS